KSTLLKMMSRITKPTTGKIELWGKFASLLEVGTGFHPELSGRENIFMNGAILGMKRHEILSKFDEIVAFSGITEFIDTPLKRYSSGMYVRLAFAVAAHLDPDILIIDEVLAVGDAEFQKKCIGKINSISKEQGRTILFVSHNMAVVENLCTRGIVLKNGSVSYDGDPKTAILNYLQVSQKADFLGKLDEIKNRNGSNEIIISAVHLRDTDGNAIDTVSCGQSFDIVFEYKVLDATFKSVNLSLIATVFNQSQVPVLYHHNNLSGDDFNSFAGYKEYIMRIDELPLVEGMYSVGVSIKNLNTFIDDVTDAFEIQVTDGKWFNNFRNPPPAFGVCLVKAKWRFGRSI
ncbi:MAG TPA: ABC transporter ATP-binding protein, partial [Cytophagaceae bacterium]